MEKRYFMIKIVLIFFALIIIFPTVTFANNINFIIQQMEESYRKQMKDIKDITIVQEMDAGFFNIESTTYQKKSIVNNQEIFKSRTETDVMGMNIVTIYDGIYTWSIDAATGEVKQEQGGVDPLQVWKIFNPSKMQYLGEEEVNGKGAYMVQLDDAIWMMGQEEIAQQNINEEAEEMEMQSIYWIDKKQFIPLKSRNIMKTTTLEDGNPVTANSITNVQFLDYKLEGSMLISHRMVISTQIDIDDPTMDEEEKQMAQSMMSAMGMGEMEMTVKSVEVNKGLSDDLFDGTKLEPMEAMFEEMPEDYEQEDISEEDESIEQEIESMSEEEINAMMEGIMDMMKDFIPKD